MSAIEYANDPKVLLDNRIITDFSEQGNLTQKGIRNCIDFEIRDGDVGIVGFHDHPNEMWINEKYSDLADFCEQQGWLRIEGATS